MPPAAVTVALDERVATITLASPPANALGTAVKEGLTGALDAGAGLAAVEELVLRCVDAARDLPFAEGMAVERDEIVRLFGTGDAREGIRAFLEKRPARFG